MQTANFKISGMVCDACVSHVAQALQNAPGVQKVAVDLAGASARVAGEGFDSAALVAAVEAEGYSASRLEY